jgi:exocyst complex component 6
LSRSLERVTGLITSKLDQFFELSEYQWTPLTREDAPSMYLYELVNWLTTVVDSLVIKEAYKDEVYKGALEYIAECLMVRVLTVAYNFIEMTKASDRIS